MKKLNLNKGFSLIEMLVALTVLSIIAIIVTQAVVSSIKGAKRSDSDSHLKENLSYAISIMERHLKNARTATCADNNLTVNYTDANQTATNFSYNAAGGFVASGSASIPLTGSNINVTSLTFVCTPQSGNTPPSVTINISAQDRNSTGVDRPQITTSSQVNLRTSY